ncbi:hypothetical protein [Ligilactobacillus aviarius]|uniref:hypothetical protein n=1 Tax=Ligilactobacillus aviarius TaxID=1606 RepID=UPI00320B3F3F
MSNLEPEKQIKILQINNDKVFIRIDEKENINIEELSGKNLFQILKNIASNKDYYDFEYEENNIKNDVYKSLVKDLIKQFIDFKNNVDNMKESINSIFMN